MRFLFKPFVGQVFCSLQLMHKQATRSNKSCFSEAVGILSKGLKCHAKTAFKAFQTNDFIILYVKHMGTYVGK